MYIWQAWTRLRARKASGINGAAPVEWLDIDAFSRLTGTRLSPWEIELLEAVDDLFLAAMARQAEDAEKRQASMTEAENG